MEKWQDNKISHDNYWGKLLNHVNNNPLEIKDVVQQWIDLFKFELGNKSKFTYIDKGQRLTVDFINYAKNKNKSLQNVLDKHVTENTDVIIDLGSGWGRHSIQLSFMNEGYNLIAGELSDSGQKITKFFTDKYNLPIESFPFNWHEPDSLIELLSGRDYKEVVLFSSNSIEQIPHLPIDLFDRICNLPINKITGVHIEPVGFQYDNTPFPFSNHYNKNMKEVLETSESNGKLEVINVDRKYYGHNTSVVANNNTLIEWVKLL